jgi:hypothetical protein
MAAAEASYLDIKNKSEASADSQTEAMENADLVGAVWEKIKTTA